MLASLSSESPSTLSCFWRQDVTVPEIETFLWSSQADQYRIISDSFHILNILWSLNKERLDNRRGSGAQTDKNFTFSHSYQVR